MKTMNRLSAHVMLLTALAVLTMYALTGMDSLLVIASALCILDAIWMWSRRNARLKAAYVDAVTTLVLSAYSPADREHAERVAALAAGIAREMGFSQKKVSLMYAAGCLHDIGRYIRNEYTSDSWHTVKGADLVSRLPVLCKTADWIRHHHTWANGVSCLASLAHQRVPIEAAILAPAEHFEEITHDDAKLLGLDEAVDDIRRRSGTQFHPVVVKAILVIFLRTLPDQMEPPISQSHAYRKNPRFRSRTSTSLQSLSRW